MKHPRADRTKQQKQSSNPFPYAPPNPSFIRTYPGRYANPPLILMALEDQSNAQLQNYLGVSVMAVEVTEYRAHRLLSGRNAQNSF
jgi:hypothetical protein